MKINNIIKPPILNENLIYIFRSYTEQFSILDNQETVQGIRHFIDQEVDCALNEQAVQSPMQHIFAQTQVQELNIFRTKLQYNIFGYLKKVCCIKNANQSPKCARCLQSAVEGFIYYCIYLTGQWVSSFVLDTYGKLKQIFEYSEIKGYYYTTELFQGDGEEMDKIDRIQELEDKQSQYFKQLKKQQKELNLLKSLPPEQTNHSNLLEIEYCVIVLKEKLEQIIMTIRRLELQIYIGFNIFALKQEFKEYNIINAEDKQVETLQQVIEKVIVEDQQFGMGFQYMIRGTAAPVKHLAFLFWPISVGTLLLPALDWLKCAAALKDEPCHSLCFSILMSSLTLPRAGVLKRLFCCYLCRRNLEFWNTYIEKHENVRKINLAPPSTALCRTATDCRAATDSDRLPCSDRQ